MTTRITVNGRTMTVPTTADVRSQVEEAEEEHGHEGLYGPMFDAWLAAHDAEVWGKGYAAGVDDGDESARLGFDAVTPNPYRAEAGQ